MRKNTEVATKKHHLTSKGREALNGYIFILPWLIGAIVFAIYPLLQALYYSFCEAKFSGNHIVTTFTFFENFKYAFTTDTTFPKLIVNYLLEIVIQVPFTITVALIIAMLLNKKIVIRSFWRVLFFLPVVIVSGPVISELIDQGATTIHAFSSMQSFIQSNFPELLSRIILLLFEKLIIVLWYSGIPILIFLSGLQRINKQVYEAAAIDGASSWQSFWKITLPSMKPFILVNAIYMIVILSNNNLTSSNDKTIIQYIQEQMIGTTGRGYGYACALGIIYLILIILHIGLYALIVLPKKKRGKKK